LCCGNRAEDRGQRAEGIEGGNEKKLKAQRQKAIGLRNKDYGLREASAVRGRKMDDGRWTKRKHIKSEP
jgi:hypothetical protein